MTILEHAMAEFKAAGFVDEKGVYCDEMQEAMCTHVLKLLDVFSEEGHSGFSAPYAIDLFSKLASFKPITPLTGEDWEWTEVGRDEIDGPLWQNKRASNVFKDKDGAYDIEGVVFYDWYTEEETGRQYKSHYTNYKSRVPVTFPYIPTTTYQETPKDET